MPSDSEVQRDIANELAWEPSLANHDIVVVVRDGVATLSGPVDSVADRWTADRVAGEVRGVKAIENEIRVEPATEARRSDAELTRAALQAIEAHVSIPSDRIRVQVDDGWVTLTGDVEWYFQKDAADSAVRYLRGMKGLINLIDIRAATTPSDVTERITGALLRGARLDASRIRVDVVGNKVILRGTVRTLAESRDAERAARDAPGIREVENRITIDPHSSVAV